MTAVNSRRRALACGRYEAPRSRGSVGSEVFGRRRAAQQPLGAVGVAAAEALFAAFEQSTAPAWAPEQGRARRRLDVALSAILEVGGAAFW